MGGLKFGRVKFQILRSCRIHPGAVKQLAVSPIDPLKLVIAYEKGVVVIWNITTKEVDRFPLDPPIKCVR